MNRIQYTVRSIPPKLDLALRRHAQKTGKRLNEVLVDTLSIGAGISADTTFNDLDWFAGSKVLNHSFTGALEWLDDDPGELL